jgi:serine/threonine protein phosphatase PrpC
VRITAGVATDIGQVREGNEDSYLAEAPLYAVADGMGGHRGGEVASQLALETVEARYAEGAPLEESVRAANTAVFERSSSDRAVAGMGTTMTAMVIEPTSVHIVHVGDSRAYLLRAGALRRLTEDHTLMQRMIAAGEITEAEAEVHPHRSVLLRSIGTDADVDLEIQDVGLLEGDRLIVCSDGLTTMITEEQVAAIAAATPSPQDAAERLVRAANRAGGIDNITVLVLDVVPDEEVDPSVAGTPEAQPRRAAGTAEPAPPPAWRGPVIRIAIAVVVLFAVFAGFRTWLDGRWYVGVANGHVAIFRGIPATILGFDLSRVDLEKAGLPADEVAALPLYEDLANGINVDSREEALQRIDQMEQDLREAQRAAAEAAGANGGANTGSGGAP